MDVSSDVGATEYVKLLSSDETSQLGPKHNKVMTYQEKTFVNSLLQQSLTNSLLQNSFQNSNSQVMNHTQYMQNNSYQSSTDSQSIQNTQSIRGAFSYNTASSINAQYGSCESGLKRNGSKKGWFGRSIQTLKSSSLSISMLAKPSDDRRANSFLAGWNVGNIIQGTTILGIPYAVQQGGWAAVATILIIGLLTCYTGKILIDCMYETSKKTGIRRRLRTNYPEIAEAAMGRKGLISMYIIQNVVMFGGVVMYIILLGTIWADVCRHITQLGLKEWAAINCCVSLPTLFITKMSIVSWFSMLSAFSIISAFLVLMSFCFTQIPLMDVTNIPPFNIETFPVGFGIILFSYCVHAVLPSIEGSMKKPQSYNSMVNCSFLLAAISKTALGALMVLTFGANTAEAATTNLNGHPWFSKITSILVIANVLLAMPLEMFVVSESFDELLLKHFPYLDKTSGYHWVWLAISRTLLMAFALLVAVTIPHFGLMMGVVGSFTGTALCFLFPCYCHIKLRWDLLSKWQVGFDAAIIFFGFLAGLLGFYFSIKGLIFA